LNAIRNLLAALSNLAAAFNNLAGVVDGAALRLRQQLAEGDAPPPAIAAAAGQVLDHQHGEPADPPAEASTNGRRRKAAVPAA
jgi:hypothetical protein